MTEREDRAFNSGFILGLIVGVIGSLVLVLISHQFTHNTQQQKIEELYKYILENKNKYEK